jgi:hypothetical protein
MSTSKHRVSGAGREAVDLAARVRLLVLDDNPAHLTVIGDFNNVHLKDL